MKNGSGLVETAVAAFDQKLRMVSGTDWARSTPCPAWRVRELAEHVIQGNRLAVALLQEGGEEEHPSERALPGGMIEHAFRNTAADQGIAFDRAAQDAVVRHPAGKLWVEDFRAYRAADIAVHAWDLSRALGVDDRLSASLVPGT